MYYKATCITFAVELSREFAGKVRSVVRHALDEPACDTSMILTLSYFGFEVIKWYLCPLLLTEICFDPELVYHIVELA